MTTRATRTTVPGHMIATEKHDGTCRVDQKAVEELSERERPLELHCAALDEDKNPKISKPNECFSFLIYVLCVGRLGLLPNRTFSQCLKAYMRLNNKKVTAKESQATVSLQMQ